MNQLQQTSATAVAAVFSECEGQSFICDHSITIVIELYNCFALCVCIEIYKQNKKLNL